MPNKRTLKIIGLTLSISILIAAGTYAAWTFRAEQLPAKSPTGVHSAKDDDEHEHADHPSDHSEQADHPHGDADEHSHGDDHGHDHGDEKPGSQDGGDSASEGQDHDEGSQIDDQVAKDLNIQIDTASPATIRQVLAVNGRIALSPESTAEVKGRFPGVIKGAALQPGQEVKVGQTLASVESNESLQTYSIPSPISGTIISRHATVGEVAGDEPLYVVADLRTLLLEIFVFADDSSRVKPGQKVRIHSLDRTLSGDAVIEVILPTTEASSQTLVARADLSNPENQWRSGVNIRAEITLSESEVPLAVRTEAIQRIEGKPVVFIRNSEERLVPRNVEIGISDSEWTEVKSGIEAGDSYVATNSFIVKADIGKAGAEHAH